MDGDERRESVAREAQSFRCVASGQDPEDSAKLQPLVRTRTISAVSTASRIDFNGFLCFCCAQAGMRVTCRAVKDSCVSATWTLSAKDCVLWAFGDYGAEAEVCR